MTRWLVTIVIVLVLVGLALSAPWWLPALLEPLLGDPFAAESITTLVQLALFVFAGLFAVLGVRWAVRGRRTRYEVITADDLEAASAGEANESEAPDTSADPPDGEEPGADDGDLPEGEALPDATDLPEGEALPDAMDPPAGPAMAPAGGSNGLTESLFGPNGAIPAGALTPNGSQPKQDSPPEEGTGLSEALFGPDGPLPSGSLEPVGLAAGAGMDMDQEPVLAPPEHQPGLESGWQPDASPPVAGKFNLPAYLPDFFGRQSELAQVWQHLVSGPGADGRQELCISSLSGMGGVGKTSLALHLAHVLANEGRFPDAQVYIDLKGSSRQPLSASAALETLLTALVGPDPQRPHDEDRLAHLWRAALQDQQVLLVLDDAAGAAQVRPLLPGSPACAVLITSQQRFALPGAGRLDLEALGPEEARAFLQSLVPRLEDAEASQIARQCGGLPLALRIAGSQLAQNDDLSPVVYAAHLASEDARLDQLCVPGEPDLDVGATLAASIDRLSESMRRSWMVLAYLPAPFDVSTAAAVWGDGSTEAGWQRLDVGEALDRLRVLRNSSLLTYGSQTGRYGQHVLLRLAASRELARLDTGQPGSAPGHTEEARLRIARHFLEVARSAAADGRCAELDPDWPHLRASLEYTSQLDTGLFSELVQVLNLYWSDRGMAREQAVWNDVAARGFAGTGQQEEEGLHLAALGAAYDELGEPQQAIETYGRAVRVCRASGNRDGEANHLRAIGWDYQQLGDAELAMQYYQQSLDLHRETGNVQGESAALGCLGRAYAAQGDHRQAIGPYQQAVALAHEVGDAWAEGTWLGDLSLSYAELGDAQRAVDTRQEALAISHAAGNRLEEAAHLVSLGDAYALMDEQLLVIPEQEGVHGEQLVTPAQPGPGVSGSGAHGEAGSSEGPMAAPRAWADEVELIPIRQIMLPMPAGVEVWINSPFPPDLDLADVVDQPVAMEDRGDLVTDCSDGGDVDLLVQDIWSTTTPLVPGSWETIAYRIRNQGTGSTCKRFYVRMWFDDTLVRTWYVDGLGAGLTAVGWVQVKVDEPGSHQIRVHADCSSGVTETDLENNVRIENWVWGEAQDEPTGAPAEGEASDQRSAPTLDGPEPVLSEWGEESELAGIRQIMLPSLPGVEVRNSQDPQAQQAGWNPGEPAADGQADLVVQDIWSNSNLTAGDWITIAFRVLNQGTLSISARFYVRVWLDEEMAGTWYVDGLAFGGTAVGWLQVRATEPGSHRIKVYADYGDAVPEADEENNARVETWHWSESAPAPEWMEPLPGKEIPIAGEILEGETGLLDGPVPVAHDWGSEGELLQVRRSLSPRVPGMEFRADQVLTSGEQTLDEAPTRTRIGVDLAILDIWSPTTPLEAQVWETLAFRIQNQGTDHANPRFYTRMWFDRTLVRTWYLDGLKAGTTGVGWVQMRVAEPGSHRIRIQVDVTNSVAEVDEENNVRSETWLWETPQPAQLASPATVVVPEEPQLGGQVETGATAGQLPLPAMTGAGTVATGAGVAQARVLWKEALVIYDEAGDPRSAELRDRLDALDS